MVDLKRVFEKIEYVQMVSIPSLYLEGITEHLMVKLREENK